MADVIENMLKAIEDLTDIEFDMTPDEYNERKSYYGEGTLFGDGIGVSVTFEEDKIKQFIIESVPGDNSYGIGYVSIVKNTNSIFKLSKDIALAIEGILKMRNLLRYIIDEDKEFIRNNEGTLTIIGNDHNQSEPSLNVMELSFEHIPTLCISSTGVVMGYVFSVRATKDYTIVEDDLNIDQAIKYVRDNK